jgi:hypothetical protein
VLGIVADRSAISRYGSRSEPRLYLRANHFRSATGYESPVSVNDNHRNRATFATSPPLE